MLLQKHLKITMAIELLLVRYHRFDVIQVVGHSTHKRDHNWSSLTVWRSGEDHLARPFSKGQTHGVSNHTLAGKVIHQRERSLLLKGGSKPQGVGHSPNSLNRKLLIKPQQYAKVSYIRPLSRIIGKFMDQVWIHSFMWSFPDISNWPLSELIASNVECHLVMESRNAIKAAVQQRQTERFSSDWICHMWPTF